MVISVVNPHWTRARIMQILRSVNSVRFLTWVEVHDEVGSTDAGFGVFGRVHLVLHFYGAQGVILQRARRAVSVELHVALRMRREKTNNVSITFVTQ